MRIIKFLMYLSILTTFFVTNNVFSQIEFVENKGQWDHEVKFMSHAGNGAVFLQNGGFTIIQHDQKDLERMVHKIHSPNAQQGQALRPDVMNSHAYNVEFVNANKSPEIIPDKLVPSVNNYFIGNDKSKWASGCKIYQGITYKNMYPGIDVRYYTDAAGRLKYDLIVQPGADVKDIVLKYNGIGQLKIKNKELIINTPLGENKELYPYTYQVIGNQRKELDCKYSVEGNIVKFKVKNYSTSVPLIIDPTQIFFTYSGSTTDNWGFTATYGPDGSFFSGGIVFGTGFRTSTGAYKESFNGGQFDIGILKLTPDGKNRIYATYIGGSDQDQPHSLISDPQGNLVIAGRTKSTDYPTSPSSNKFGDGGGWDIIVTKLNATGGGLIGSMVIGGVNDDGVNIKDRNGLQGTISLNRNYGDDARSEVILDAAGNIYLASCTQSKKFTSASSLQDSSSGMQDAVVLKINPTVSNVIWSRFLGGTANDAAYVLALGNNNNLYAAGGTASKNFKGISSSGVLSSAYSGGDCDGYIIEMSNDGAILGGTFLGTNVADQVYGIQTDKTGNVYVMGTTEGIWKTTPNVGFINVGSKQFISKLPPDLSNYVYSTTFGSGSSLPNISPTAFLVDRCENVYVSGWGGKSNTLEGYGTGTTKGMPVTPDAIKPLTDPSGSDFYFFVLKKDAASQLYGTFFGQQDPLINGSPETFGDHVDGGTSRFDKYGVIYQAMCANCGRKVTFLGSPGSWSTRDQAATGAECNLGMLKIEMNFAGVVAGPRASIKGVPNDTVGCVPLTVDFSDTLQKGKRFIWDFGDGTPKVNTTDFNTSHVFTNVGTYRIMLVAIDSTTCNVTDTAYVTIKAGNNEALLNFISNKLPPCTNLSYRFDNATTALVNSFGPQSFTWDFGDGSAPLIAGLESVNHTYAGPGTYQVKLSLDDSDFCNSPDDTTKPVRLSPKLTASFSLPLTGCVPYNAVFQNTSLGGLNFLWDFGDGSSSTQDSPAHLYTTVGNFVVKLYAFDSTACNVIDSAKATISVNPIPSAAFIFNPTVPAENTFTQFTNQSTGAINYLWNFGDGDTSVEVNPRHIFPATGTFNVCLNAQNEAGCSADTCMPVQSLIKPLLDVPSAFTPGKFGINGIVRVEGFGITNMHWSIYNRWGEKVFETTSPKIGWTGVYKGKVQPMDVYAYTLDVIFSDGKKYRKTGDITLLR